MHKFIAGIALSIAAFVVPAHAEGTLRFGVDPTFAPFESKSASGELVGFEIDLGNEICKRLEVKCVWVETGFDGIIPALQGRKFDAILSAMSITAKRQEQVAFSQPLFNTPSRLIAKEGSPLKPTVDSLKGHAVGIAQGTMQESYAAAYWKPAGVNVVAYPNQEAIWADLRAGRIDATLTDSLAGSLGFLKTPQGKGYGFAGGDVSDPKTMGIGAGIGFRKGDDALRAKVDGAISAIFKDGTFRKIEAKYFDFDISGR